MNHLVNSAAICGITEDKKTVVAYNLTQPPSETLDVSSIIKKWG